MTLRDALEREASGMRISQLSEAVARLSTRYRAVAAANEPILARPVDVLAYAHYRMPATFGAVRSALRALAGSGMLDADAVTANCLAHVLAGVRDNGWVHHIPRLMVLCNYGLQRGWSPQELTDWFHRCFVDGYDWVMTSNVVGMSQHADGGLMATKPYASGGAYIDRMSDFCGGCAYDPKVRVGDRACPYTAGYWAFLDRNRERLAGNHRMRQPLRGLDRLADVAAVAEQERARGAGAP